MRLSNDLLGPRIKAARGKNSRGTRAVFTRDDDRSQLRVARPSATVDFHGQILLV